MVGSWWQLDYLVHVVDRKALGVASWRKQDDTRMPVCRKFPPNHTCVISLLSLITISFLVSSPHHFCLFPAYPQFIWIKCKVPLLGIMWIEIARIPSVESNIWLDVLEEAWKYLSLIMLFVILYLLKYSFNTWLSWILQRFYCVILRNRLTVVLW